MYRHSRKCLENNQDTINPKNKDNKHFQYAITVELNHNKISKSSERISNFEKCTDNYNWEYI